MSETRHTPGPWRTRGKSEGIHIESVTGHALAFVAVPFGERAAAAIYDARLMAAAPEMLAALELVMLEFDAFAGIRAHYKAERGDTSPETDPPVQARARAALAKARGA